MFTDDSEVADKYGYGVVEHFVGHGVGQVFHSAPSILHNREFLFVPFYSSLLSRISFTSGRSNFL